MEDKDETKKGIELDTLEVDSKTGPPAGAPPAEETVSEPDALPEKTSIFRQILVLVSKNKLFVGAVLAGLVVASGVIYVSLKHVSSDKVGAGAHYTGRIVYEITTTLGSRHDVSFRLSVPFRNDKEKTHLMQKLPGMKHELSISVSDPAVARSIEQNDLKTLGKHIVRKVHALTGVPTEDLAVEALSVD